MDLVEVMDRCTRFNVAAYCLTAGAVLFGGYAAFAAGDGYVQPPPGRFERMMFNNPGLEVDLSLGIWPHESPWGQALHRRDRPYLSRSQISSVIFG